MQVLPWFQVESPYVHRCKLQETSSVTCGKKETTTQEKINLEDGHIWRASWSQTDNDYFNAVIYQFSHCFYYHFL